MGDAPDNKRQPDKIGSTIVLRPSWQGRHIGKAIFTIKNKKIVNFKKQDLRLSSKIKDDPQISAILPKCFSDANCKKDKFIGICQNPGSMNSACVFNKAAKVSLLVIKPKACVVCNEAEVVNFLQRAFPGLAVSYINYPSSKADKLIKDLAIAGLPVYLLDKNIEQEKAFMPLSKNLEQKGQYYMLKPEFSGMSYFQDRKYIKGKLDVFISLYDKNTPAVLEAVKTLQPNIHFLVIEKDGSLYSLKGAVEIEEYARSLCVQKLYPQQFWNYLTCRSKNIESSWWEDCLGNYDAGKIKSCARSPEGNELLRKNTALNRELRVTSGPVYLMHNQQIFGTQGEPKKEELEKILNKRGR
jgi:hypothetical protein